MSIKYKPWQLTYKNIMFENNKPISVNLNTDVLCFDKNEFMKANFSVDEFLHKNRNAPSLEHLRDNLGLYLKGLRASMIDLINEDYADFVSLSANLVGLDQSIENIQKPLEQFREEIVSIKTLINLNETEMRSYLEEKRQLRELKRNLQSLKKVYETVNKLEALLTHQLNENTVCAVDLERAALELIQLKFNEKFCTKYLNADHLQKIDNLSNSVLDKLRKFFNKALKTANSACSEDLERALRIYITLDACKVAELVFKEDVVAPYMKNIISEHALQNSPQGLAGIYSKVLNFISLHMTDILRLTQYSDKLRGFNFVVNSFWADVEMRLETHMSSIFAPGNSDVFYAKYKCTRDFLIKIEQLLEGEMALKEFRLHKQTKSFQARWNLPVYFQICFQEIAGYFESTLEPLLCDETLNLISTSKDDFQLKPFRSGLNAIDSCWNEGVFLIEVFPKFYKLTLQIVLRLSRWITDIMNFVDIKKGTLELPQKLRKTNFLVILYVDIQKFIEHLLELQEKIIKNIPSDKRLNATKISETINSSFIDLQHIFCKHQKICTNSLVDILILESGVENIRQVNDLPRLYRKTNREVPSRCSTYVEQMLRPMKIFSEQSTANLGSKITETVLSKVFSRVTKDYYTAVSSVLTSVQKTEESLRRLRNLKSTTVSSINKTMPDDDKINKTMSDDDKIRLQLRVDVTTWTGELAKFNFTPSQIDKLNDLNTIVEDSIKMKEG